MSPTQKKRLTLILWIFFSSCLLTGLILYALSQNLNAFYTPEELDIAILENPTIIQKKIRLGGMIKENTVIRKQGLNVNFTITDFKKELNVDYTGILPDLFKEGKGIIADGNLVQDKTTGNMIFQADQIMAKHDENYMPPQIPKNLQS